VSDVLALDSPLFQLDAHLTRDFTERFWGSLDAAWYNGGQASINGVEGEKLNNIAVGLTLATSRPSTTPIPAT
jgi:hypothetical protein